MPRNPGNRHRDIKIYPDANLKFVRMEFTENKKINLKRVTGLGADVQGILQAVRGQPASSAASSPVDVPLAVADPCEKVRYKAPSD